MVSDVSLEASEANLVLQPERVAKLQEILPHGAITEDI
jgi:hypothetical protein